MKEPIKCVLPDGLEQMETGPIQFGDDYAGVFFRGEIALSYGVLLNLFLVSEKSKGMDWINRPVLECLASYLISCDDTVPVSP